MHLCLFIPRTIWNGLGGWTLTTNYLKTLARGIPSLPKHLLPFPSEFTFTIPDTSMDILGGRIDTELQTLDLQWQWRSSMATGVGFAMGNVWSRQARRKRQHEDVGEAEVDEDEALLGFKIRLCMGSKESKDVQVVVRWLKGRDSVLFESFCGMVKRKVEGR